MGELDGLEGKAPTDNEAQTEAVLQGENCCLYRNTHKALKSKRKWKEKKEKKNLLENV